MNGHCDFNHEGLPFLCVLPDTTLIHVVFIDSLKAQSLFDCILILSKLPPTVPVCGSSDQVGIIGLIEGCELSSQL